MKKTPVLFNADMVRAILEGRKQQTRRSIKSPINNYHNEKLLADWPLSDLVSFYNSIATFNIQIDVDSYNTEPVVCPFGDVDDILWVRETWAETTNINGSEDWPGRPHVISGKDEFGNDDPNSVYIYRADGEWNWCDGDGFSTERSSWSPSIHMPYEACRLFLKITDIRVERLNEIRHHDAIAEGVEKLGETPTEYGIICNYRNYRDSDTNFTMPQSSFRSLWESIYGVDSWEKNEYVWVVSFEKTEKPA